MYHPNAQNSTSWNYASDPSRVQPTPYAPSIRSIPLPHGGSPYFSDPSTPSSSIRQGADGPSLHYLLDYDRTGRLLYDIRLPPNHSHPKMAQRLNIREAATVPAVQQMYIRIPGLPWAIDVRNPQGVTLENVLSTMFATLQGVVAKEEYGVLSSQLANTASTTFHARARINPQAMSEGVKRVDCLGSKILFLGITRAVDGSNTWNVRFSTEYAWKHQLEKVTTYEVN